ncbi:gpW family head-tail joining protein [Sphingopyxis sp. GW247-27LB]|uniref:gpW family head-tail joining protein n=1 Tax=Sphingopyxis sp. GW247-27LB TaxID=2012632 RepID=UPI000BA5C10B|nr:gpW family head-tail joining protein [Sphingopyxis sp. GW247-27LB]PAL23528.1 hypothetical protein CD928_05530 [Sphingopyxis sp. GW247-27LB]
MTDAELLAEAKTAYHALMTGRSVVEARDQNGEMVRYGIANAGRLAAYIDQLERKIDPTKASGPMRLIG